MRSFDKEKVRKEIKPKKEAERFFNSIVHIYGKWITDEDVSFAREILDSFNNTQSTLAG